MAGKLFANISGCAFGRFHDRYFLDKICTSILSLEHGSVKRYAGNYSQFYQKREQQRIEEERHYKNAQKKYSAWRT